MTDPTVELIKQILTGGGALGYLVAGFLLADRFGFLKRKNGNGNGGGGVAHEQRVILLLEQIEHQLERLLDSAERNARDVLAAIANKG